MPGASWPAPIAIAEPRAGDFCCVPISGPVGLGISIGQWLAGDRFGFYDHAEFYVGEPDAAGPFGYTIGAYPGGARKVALPCRPAELPGSLWSSGLIELTDAQRLKLVAWAQHVVDEKIGYSFLDYAAIIAHMAHLPVPGLREYIDSTRHMDCSQVIDAGELFAGVHLFDDRRWPGYVKPADLSGKLQALLAGRDS
jgi:hypothetical protein